MTKPTPFRPMAPISRRTMFRWAAAGGLVVAGGPLLAACGSGDGGGATTGGASASGSAGGSVAPTGTLAKGGVLRVGFGGGSSASTMDAHHAPDAATSNFSSIFYNQITIMDGSFKLAYELGEEFTPNADGSEWTLKLKPDVEFHHGKTLSADDVIFSFTRILDPKTAATVAGQVAMIKKMSAVDKLTVKFELSAPTGWFPQAVGDAGLLGIVPTDYDPTKPVSTGPFKFESFNAGVSLAMVRFDNYFQGPALVDRFEGQVINDSSAALSALQAGQVDMILGVDATQAPVIQSDANLVLYDSPSGAMHPITMRVDDGVTKDVRVRQALRLSVDRDQVLASAYGGFGKIANDLYSPYDSSFPTDLVRTRDVEGAKKLIAEAGADGAEITLTTVAFAEPACQVIAQNASDVGIKITVNKVDEATLFGPNYLQWPMAVDSYPSLGFMAVAAISDGPEAVINQTHFDDEEYNTLFEQASAEVDEGKRNEIINKMQHILFEKGGYIIPVYLDTLIAHSAKVGGLPQQNDTSLEQFRRMNQVGFYA